MVLNFAWNLRRCSTVLKFGMCTPKISGIPLTVWLVTVGKEEFSQFSDQFSNRRVSCSSLFMR